MDLKQIEHLAHTYSNERDHLGALVTALQRDLEDVKGRYLDSIQAALRLTAAAQEQLKGAVQGAPGLFEKPRTHIFHGVRVGWAKQKDALEIPDPEKTVALIRKYFPEEQSTVLIRTKEDPNKKALEQLSPAELKRIGVLPVPGEDAVVLKPVDGEIDKLVGALLKATDLEAAQAA